MRWKPLFGRLSPKQSARFGEAMTHGFGYIGLGPIYVVFNLPARWRKADPPTRALMPSREIFARKSIDGEVSP